VLSMCSASSLVVSTERWRSGVEDRDSQSVSSFFRILTVHSVLDTNNSWWVRWLTGADVVEKIHFTEGIKFIVVLTGIHLICYVFTCMHGRCLPEEMAKSQELLHGLAFVHEFWDQYWKRQRVREAES
jgi:hypothetical protein